jgi:hypothetical protein
MSALKRSAPGREIAGAAKLRLVKAYHACAHSATITQREPPESLHHAREVCAGCERFIRWLAKPETLERRKLNGFRLAKLGMCERLTAWERNFVRDALRQRKLSPRQQEIVDELAAKHLRKAAA